jgi:hypothetical protein
MHVSPFSRRRRRNCRGFGYSQRSEIRVAGSPRTITLLRRDGVLSRARVHMAMTPTRRCSTSPAASSPRGRPTGGIYPNRLLTRPEFIPRAIRVLTPFAHPHSVESRTTAIGLFSAAVRSIVAFGLVDAPIRLTRANSTRSSTNCSATSTDETSTATTRNDAEPRSEAAFNEEALGERAAGSLQRLRSEFRLCVLVGLCYSVGGRAGAGRGRRVVGRFGSGRSTASGDYSRARITPLMSTREQAQRTSRNVSSANGLFSPRSTEITSPRAPA